MRNKRLIIALTGAVLCGVLAVVLITRYLSQVEAYTKDLGTVVVAKTEIPLGEKISPDKLALAPIPNGSSPQGAMRKLDDVIGRVAIVPIGVREIITSQKLAPAGVGGGLSAAIPEGYRAITVKVDEVVGVSGFVMPGSFVDVVAVVNAPGNSEPVSKIVLQNIKVLATGPKIDSPENQREPTSVHAMTLQVTPEQAEKLALAENEGRLQLVMRNYGDQEDAPTKGATRSALLAGNGYTPQPQSSGEKADKTGSAKHGARRSTSRIPLGWPREAPPQPAQPVKPSPRFSSVELIEGAKKRNVELP
jgi:pilus assembly protein CpaB